MNRSTILLTALLAGVPVEARAQADDTLTVLTYNIHGLLDDGSPPEWDSVLADWLVEAILELNPDIVGFQEVLQGLGSDGADNQLRALADSLTARSGDSWNYRVAMSHVSWDRFEEGLGILTRHPIADSAERSLKAKDRFQRKALGARIRTPLGDVEFVTTHHAYREDADSVRSLQVAEVKEFAFGRAGAEIPLIIVGDFNAEPDREPIRLLKSPDGAPVLVDVWAELMQDGPESESGNTFSASDPTRRIDYVLVGARRGLVPVQIEVVFDALRDGAFLSDHLGVFARLVPSTE